MTTAASIDDPAGPCPGDNTLAAVVDGGGSANGSLLAHLSRCGQCQALVAEILRDGNEEDTRYEIERLIGIGGMGLVVRARDAVLERAVALKVLWRGSADSPGNSAVLAEARTMARFAHPNIVTVHDAGQLPRVGAPFIAMELVDGESLRQWLTRAHSWQEVVDVFVDAAKGLEAAHAVGIVHADFKPANVLLADDGARTRVTDFGLAHHIAGQSDPRRAVGGTPRYTAPEQRERSPDARSDQYAFGVALHEALWGEHPHREGPCPAVGCPSVPSRLRRVVGRCTNEDPALRSPSMTVVIDELRRRPKASARALWIAGAIALAVPAAVVAVWPADTCARAGAHAREQWQQSLRPSLAGALDSEAWARAAGPTETWVDGWVQRSEASCRQHDPPVVMACLEERWSTLEVLTRKIAADDGGIRGAAPLALAQLPGVEACRKPAIGTVVAEVAAVQISECAAAVAEGRASLLLGDVNNAEAALHHAIAVAEAHGLQGLQARAHLILAKSRWQAGEPDEAFDQFSTASDLAVRAGLTDLGALAMGEAAQYIAFFRHDAVVARRWLAQARALASRGSDATTTLNLDRVEAWVRWTEGNHSGAAEQMRSVIARIDQDSGRDALAQATNHKDLAHFLSDSGDPSGALVEVDASIALRRAALGKAHPSVADALHAKATILQGEDRFAEAAQVLAEVRASWTAAYGPDSGAVALASLLRADVLMDAEDYDAAAESLAVAQRVFLAPDARDATRASLTRQLQARLANGQGHPQRARQLLQALLDEGLGAHPLSAQRIALIHRELGLAELALGNGVAATRWLTQALDGEADLDATTRGGLHFGLAQAGRAGGGCSADVRRSARRAIEAWRAKGSEQARARADTAAAWLASCD